MPSFSPRPRNYLPRALPLIAALACTVIGGCTAPQEDTAAGDAAGERGSTPYLADTQQVDAETENSAATTTAPAPEVHDVGPRQESGVVTSSKRSKVTPVDTKMLADVVEGTRGKFTVLNMWATWCGPCVEEMPDLVEFYNETDRDEVAFISLSIDDVAEIAGAIPQFQRDHEISFPIYVLSERNQEGVNRAIRTTFSGAVPMTVIYDKDGNVVQSILGAVTLAQLREWRASASPDADPEA